MVLKETECKCDECVKACKTRSCWGTPEDIEILIKNGYEKRLMIDWYHPTLGTTDYEDERNTFVLVPAMKGYENKKAPFDPRGVCNFLVNNLCEIHKIKPIEGKLYIHDCDIEELQEHHKKVAISWNSDKGKELIKHFKEQMEK